MPVPEIPDNFERAKAGLRPVIFNRSFFDELHVQAKIDDTPVVPIPFMPVGDHLVACIVYARGTTRQFVHRLLLNQWEVQFREALRAARKNLSVQIDADHVEGGVYAPDVGDSFDASRILFKRQIQRLPFQGEPVALVVNGNRLFVTGSKDNKGIGRLAELAEEYQDESNLLCPSPVRLVEKKWKSWMPSTEHSHYERYKKLARRFFLGEYKSQQQRLTNFYESRNDDIFVAGFTAMRNDQTGEELSYTVWTDGVTALLPKADRVHFYISESEPVRWAPWHEVVNAVGHLMSPQPGRYPPRWHVARFPTQAHLQQMGAKKL